MKQPENIIKIFLIILFIGALFNMPYNYYEIMRFLGMVCFAVLGYKEFEGNNKTFMVIWFASALLINPFFKIDLGKALWNIIDVIWILFLLISFTKVKKTE